MPACGSEEIGGSLKAAGWDMASGVPPTLDSTKTQMCRSAASSQLGKGTQQSTATLLGVNHAPELEDFWPQRAADDRELG